MRFLPAPYLAAFKQRAHDRVIHDIRLFYLLRHNNILKAGSEMLR